MLIADLEEFAGAHRAHGQLFAGAGPPGRNGYRLESLPLRCRVRWVMPTDAAVELALLARWN